MKRIFKFSRKKIVEVETIILVGNSKDLRGGCQVTGSPTSISDECEGKRIFLLPIIKGNIEIEPNK